MLTTNSMLYCIYLDFKRGLLNKRFWTVLGSVSLIFLLHVILDGVWPLSHYYYGGEESFYLWGGRIYTSQGEIEALSNMELFSDFFPFLCAAAYAYTIIDDRRQGYYIQQLQRIGFPKYYWGKLVASGLLGGLFGALCMVVICLVSMLFTAWNPFIKEAVDFCAEWDALYRDMTSISRYVGWEPVRAYCNITSSVVWYFMGGVKYFVMGVLYGLLASMIAFLTDNKVIMYAGPVIYLLLQDKWLYLLLDLVHTIFSVSVVTERFSLRSGRILYGDLYHYFLLLFMIALLLNLAKLLQHKTEYFYMEGGSAGD